MTTTTAAAAETHRQAGLYFERHNLTTKLVEGGREGGGGGAVVVRQFDKTCANFSRVQQSDVRCILLCHFVRMYSTCVLFSNH